MWWELAWAALVLTLVLMVGGGLVGAALGLKGLWLYATAPLAAMPFIGVAAIAAPLVGVSWGVLPVLALLIVVAAVIWLTRRRWGNAMPARALRPWMPLALIVGGALVTAQVVLTIGSPTDFSQTFDNAFHLNVIRFILDTGNGSSLWVGHLTDHSGTAAFYPALWHDVVSLVAQLTGVEITVALNATTLVIAAVIWPAGVVLLSRQLFGTNRVVLVSAGVLAGTFPAFPLLLMDYGVLYPYQLGVALLPGTIAVALRAARIGQKTGTTTGWQDWLLLVGILPGVALAHPGAFVAWLAFTVPVGVALAIRGWVRGRGVVGRIAVAVAFLVYLVIGFALLRVLRPSAGRDWPTESGIGEALRDVVTASVWYGAPAVLGAVVVVAGIVWALFRRTPAGLVAVGMLAVAVFLYVVVSALPYPTLRDLLTGTWYNNIPRLVALLPVAAVPIGAYGVAASWTWLRVSLRRTRAAGAVAVPARWAIGVAAVVSACVLTQVGPLSAVPTAIDRASSGYAPSPEAPLVDSDELALLERIGDEVPEDAVIVGSPWTGTALAYALAERQVVLPHMFTTTTPEEDEILQELNAAEPGSPVCDALAAVRVSYVLDFGSREVHGAEHVFPGLTELDASDAVELVDSEGHAKLYRVVGC